MRTIQRKSGVRIRARSVRVNGTTASVEPIRPLLLEDLVSYLFPSSADGKKPTWPADAFAIAACILRHSGAYVEVANTWPPSGFSSLEAWHDKARRLRKQWRKSYLDKGTWPTQVDRWWKTILSARLLPVERVRDERGLVEALTGIVAAADETCFGVGILKAIKDGLDERAIYLLTTRNSLCENVHPSRATVLPKLHNPLNGMTLRSLTHNLALWDRAEVTPIWQQVDLPDLKDGMNLLLLPWPLRVAPTAFRASADNCGQHMPDGFGFFTYDLPRTMVDVRAVRDLLTKSEALVGRIDAVVFPELSLSQRDFERVRRVLGARLVIAGVGESATPTSLGRNDVAVGLGSSLGRIYRQSKHHRWRLDPPQITQYGLPYELAARHSWWEAIDLSPRCCTFFSANKWLTFCVLICEDLARQDPVAELVRSVGPNLVVALLMDGPQIQQRWSARYATVLAEDPRCSVLSLTSAGLVDLACAQDDRGPRSVGLWKDALSGGARQILLERGAGGVVLSLSREMAKEYTADGRHDDTSTGYLRLVGIHQVPLAP